MPRVRRPEHSPRFLTGSVPNEVASRVANGQAQRILEEARVNPEELLERLAVKWRLPNFCLE